MQYRAHELQPAPHAQTRTRAHTCVRVHSGLAEAFFQLCGVKKGWGSIVRLLTTAPSSEDDDDVLATILQGICSILSAVEPGMRGGLGISWGRMDVLHIHPLHARNDWRVAPYESDV